MPLYRRLPKRGFKNISQKKIQKINFNTIDNLIKNHKINPSEIKETDLFNKKILSKSNGDLKLLNVGDVKSKFDIEISYASKTAIKSVEAAGGSVTLIKK